MAVAAEWQYAVMTVRVASMTTDHWTYEAKAWVEETEIYSRALTTMYWSVPLADMGRDGWELVTASPENALMPSWVEGWSSSTSRPVQMDFIFKRPARAG